MNNPETKSEIFLAAELKKDGRRFTSVQKSWSKSHQLEVAERMKKRRLREMLHTFAQQSRDKHDSNFNAISLTNGFGGQPIGMFDAGGGTRIIRSTRGLS